MPFSPLSTSAQDHLAIYLAEFPLDQLVPMAEEDGGDVSVDMASTSTSTSMGAAQDPSSSTSVSTSTTSKSLAPSRYVSWIRSAERKLISFAKGKEKTLQGSNGEDGVEEAGALRLLHALWEAFEAKRSMLHLGRRQWRILVASKLWAIRSYLQSGAEGPSLLPLWQEVIQLQAEATKACEGSALDLASFVTYVALLLELHWSFEEVPRGKRPGMFWENDEEEEEEQTWRVEATEDILQTWTGLQSGPKLLKLRYRHATSTLLVGFDMDSIPPIPTRSQARASGVEAEWESILGADSIRQLLREANSRAAGELNWSHLIWNSWRDFEMYYLGRQKSNSQAAAEVVKQMYVNRLRIPHRMHETTAQEFSSFVSKYLPPNAYESTMASMQKAYSQVKETWSALEAFEDRVLTPPAAEADNATYWSAWKDYLRSASSSRDADIDHVSAVYERSIAYLGLSPALSTPSEEAHPPDEEWESQQKKERAKVGREQRQALDQQERLVQRTAWARREEVWIGYIAFLSSSKAPASQLLEVLDRAVRSLPASGTLWAAHLRQVARLHGSKQHIGEIFARAIEGGECSRDDQSRAADSSEARTQVVEVCVGYIDAERELAAVALAREQGSSLEEALAQLPKDSERFLEVYSTIMYTFAIPSEEQPAAKYDRSLRLQILASAWAEAGGEATASLGESIWETALAQQPTNALVWLEAARLHARLGNIRKARSLYRQGASRHNVTEKAQLLDDWRRFETVYGGTDEIEKVDRRRREERDRQWDEWAKYAEMQQREYELQYAASAQPAVADGPAATGMDVDASSRTLVQDSGQKRKIDEDMDVQDTHAVVQGSSSMPTSEASKKGKGAGTDSTATRDRENSSIMVADLPSDASEPDLRDLFADCGPIREINGPSVVVSSSGSKSAAGVVEFMDRSAIPAARTKDKKRVGESSVTVSLGWECTLYVTNFPLSFDDRGLRDLFAPYGAIFDIRWPSKRFDSSRRFCYVQYTHPSSAREALALHHRQLGAASEETQLEVYLSDPARRKQRTDQNANEKEVYISNLPRGITESDVLPLIESLCSGLTIEGFRMPRIRDGPEKGKTRGLAFVDLRNPTEAQMVATKLNGQTLGSRTIKAQVAEAKASHQQQQGKGLNVRSAAGRSTSPSTASHARSPSLPPPPPSITTSMSTAHGDQRQSNFRLRALKVRHLPPTTQEALIQQFFEGVVASLHPTASAGTDEDSVAVAQPAPRVIKVEWQPGLVGGDDGSSATGQQRSHTAIVEFDSPATAGKVLLLGEQMEYRPGVFIQVLPLDDVSVSGAGSSSATNSNGGDFVPRATRGRAGRGRARGRGAAALGAGLHRAATRTATTPSSNSNGDSHSNGAPTAMDVDAATTSQNPPPPQTAEAGNGKKQPLGQDAFRRMLAGE